MCGFRGKLTRDEWVAGKNAGVFAHRRGAIPSRASSITAFARHVVVREKNFLHRAASRNLNAIRKFARQFEI
jgi:hypothetical protein